MVVALLLIGVVLLVGGAELLVRGGGQLALALRVPALVVGLTVVAFGTSAPELAVSLEAAMRGSTDMALANVIGSNIANIALVLGLAALVRPLRIAPALVRRELPICLGLQVLVLLLCLDGRLGRLEGAILVAAGVGYNTWLLLATLRGRKLAVAEEVPTDEGGRRWVQVLLVLGGMLLLVAGAVVLVDAAEQVAGMLGLDQRYVGLTVLALGTSAPEIATAMVSAWRNEADLAVGNSLGSNILNIVMVLGLTAMVAPIAFEGGLGMVDQFVAIGVIVVLWVVGSQARRLGRVPGALMVLGYLGYLMLTPS